MSLIQLSFQMAMHIPERGKRRLASCEKHAVILCCEDLFICFCYYFSFKSFGCDLFLGWWSHQVILFTRYVSSAQQWIDYVELLLCKATFHTRKHNQYTFSSVTH